MADERAWLDPALSPELGEANHDCEEGGLDDVEAIQPLGLGVAQDLLQRPIDVWGQRLFALAHVGCEGRRCLD
ncbi:hypothetical protein D3C83_264270 [compost metagenome]